MFELGSEHFLVVFYDLCGDMYQTETSCVPKLLTINDYVITNTLLSLTNIDILFHIIHVCLASPDHFSTSLHLKPTLYNLYYHIHNQKRDLIRTL